jgi:hypothetical protein
VIDCAHANKEETKTSLLSSQESFGFSINRASREKGCVKSDEDSTESEGWQKEGGRRRASEKKN